MGRVRRKNVKRLSSGPKNFFSPKKHSKCNKESKARLSNSIVEKQKRKAPTRVVNKLYKEVNSTKKILKNINNLTKFNDKLVSNSTVSSRATLPNITSDVKNITDTVIDDNECVNFHSVPSKITVQKTEKDDIIDITNDTIYDEHENFTVSSKVTLQNNENYDIIDITDTTVCNNEHECPTVSSRVIVQNVKINEIIDITDITINENKAISCNDGIQFTSNVNRVQNQPIEIFTISDSEDENTPYQQFIEKSVGFKSRKNHLRISPVSTNKIIKSYISPLRNHRKLLKGVNVQQEVLSHNIGAFIIDKQKMSKNSYNHNAVTFSQERIPTTDATLYSKRQLRPIIIDGLNIGHAHGRGTFSAKGIVLCVEYFAQRGHKEIVAFIPQHRQGAPGTETNIIINKLLKTGNLCFTPSRKVQNQRMTCYDDRILLNYANDCNGVVVSNDNYRDLYEENDAFKDIIENRQVMVTFVKDKIIVPDDQYNRKFHVRSLLDILCFPA